MSKVRARELGFDACMFMLHKTFGVPKAGGGPAVGAYGCSAELAPFLPGPLVTFDGERYHLSEGAENGVGRVREFLGNVPQVVKAYAWVRAMGADGISQAADLSVLANNYMETRLLKIRGVSKSHPHLTKHRMEMTRYSLGQLAQDTGVTAVDVQNRMVDFGVDAFWLSHEPWVIPEPFTPGGRRDVVEGGPRLLDRRPRAHLRGGLQRPGDRQEGAPQPGRAPARPGGARRSRALGDDVAGGAAQAGRYAGRGLSR